MNSPARTIRRATVADARRIAEIQVRTGQHAFRAHVPAHILDAIAVEDRIDRWVERTGRQDPRSSAWVAEIDGNVVGFCFVEPGQEEGNSSSTGLLKSLYVEPAHAEGGVGSVLMETGLRALADAGFEAATLWVIDANERAQAFYRHRGWEPDGAVRTEEISGFTYREVRMRRTTALTPSPSPVRGRGLTGAAR